jgi:hypothetical protein
MANTERRQEGFVISCFFYVRLSGSLNQLLKANLDLMGRKAPLLHRGL